MSKPRTTLSVIAAFVGVFLAGAVAGGFVSLRVKGSYVQKKAVSVPEQFSAQHLRRLTEKLGLTSAQQEKIKPLLLVTEGELKRLRHETGDVFHELDEKIVLELTSEQKPKFEEMRRRWQKLRPPPRNGGPSPDGPPPPEPPPAR